MPHEFFKKPDAPEIPNVQEVEQEVELPKTNSVPKSGIFFPFSMVLLVFMVIFGIVLIIGLASAPYLISLKDIYTQSMQGKADFEEAQALVIDQNFTEATEKLHNAELRFSNARQDLEKFNELPFTNIGFIEKQTTAVDHILVAGIQIAQSLQDLTLFGDDILEIINQEDLNFSQITEKQKRDILAKLFEAPPILQGVKSGIDLAVISIDTIPKEGVLDQIIEVADLIDNNLKIVQTTLEEVIPLIQIAPQVSGFPNEMTYLFLLQNNTEIRPTGGFIGTYGILKVKNAEIVSFETDNIYNLDTPAKEYLNVSPPEPIQKYLKATQWFLRDSNWSPDFEESAILAEDFYYKEGGQEDLDGIIAITPTLIESLLEITGEIEVDGIVFNSENFTEALEFEVEKAYLERGKTEEERKEIIGDMADILMARLMNADKDQWPEIFKIIENNIFERHILLYFEEDSIQQMIVNEDWSGKVKQTDNDYLMVVDANLAALKTDSVMDKDINYSLTVNDQNEILGKITVNYFNDGAFTWYTTRYRSYTRIYLPKGAELIKVQGIESGSQDFYDELDKTVVGGFLIVEPQESKDLVVEYKLPPRILQQIQQGQYSLLVQKQSGTIAHDLTVELGFNGYEIDQVIPSSLGTRVLGDNHIKLENDLRRDREFTVSF